MYAGLPPLPGEAWDAAVNHEAAERVTAAKER
jgi:hypothetical protein